MKFACIPFAAFLVSRAAWAASAPLPIAASDRATPVDFDREVAPFLSDNCLSCHSQTTTKGGLNLETPELMLKGGENGAAIVPKKSGESLILQAAAHLDDDLTMPPRDNKAKAKNLTPEQLGLLKLWIDQGAIASPKRERPIAWQPFPEELKAIYAVAVTGDGQFAACSRANRVFVYHLPSVRLVAVLTADRDQVNALAFSPDGTLLASGGYREVSFWRRTKIEGKPAQSIEGAAGKIVRVDGQRSVTLEGNVAKLCAADGKVIAELSGNRPAREFVGECERAVQVKTGAVAFGKDAVQSAEKSMQTAQERVKKSTDALAPKEAELDGKRKIFAEATAAKTAAEQTLAGADADLQKADAVLRETATKAAQLAAADAEALAGAAAVDANKLSTDVAAAFQDAAKARAERDQRGVQRRMAADKIEPAAKQITAAEDAEKKAEAAKGAAVAQLEAAKAEEQKTTTALSDAKAAVDLAEAARKKAEDALQSARQAATAAEQPIRTAAFSPDGATLATGGDDRLIHTWSAQTGEAFDVVSGHTAAITAVAYGPTGELVSTAADGAALAWDLSPKWTLERTIGGNDGNSPFADRVNAVAFSPDGKRLATGGGEPSRGGEIRLWDVATGQIVNDFPKIHSDAVFSLEFSPDGKALASGAADKMARIVDLATGKVLRSFEGHTHHVLGVSWSADGRTLATAGADGVVKIWDAATGERKKNIDGYDQEVTAVRFVAASATVLTSSGDDKVRLVGIDGKEVRTFADVSEFMEAVAVSADGRVVVAGGQDGVLRTWNAADGAKISTFEPLKR